MPKDMYRHEHPAGPRLKAFVRRRRYEAEEEDEAYAELPEEAAVGEPTAIGAETGVSSKPAAKPSNGPA